MNLMCSKLMTRCSTCGEDLSRSLALARSIARALCELDVLKVDDARARTHTHTHAHIKRGRVRRERPVVDLQPPVDINGLPLKGSLPPISTHTHTENIKMCVCVHLQIGRKLK